MRQSLVNYSSRVLSNLSKTHARRARAFKPLSNEEGDNVIVEDTVTVSLPRFIEQDFRERSQKALEGIISASNSTYQDVWKSYLTLQAVVQQDGGPPIPKNLMQAVLRKCSPSFEALRVKSMQPTSESGSWKRIRQPLPYEQRLRAVIRHMRDAQQPPNIQDYNFILGQMAAVGHVKGAAAVLREMEDVGGIQPSISSFSYVLRACIFLLESTQPDSVRPILVELATELASNVVKRLSELNMEMDTRIIELVLRVFKETGDIDAFERLMRVMCAFDVTKPDRMPEEFEERLKAADLSGEPLPMPIPLTTSMFTTLLTLYGRIGDIPKMITTFEVLTNPYPLPSNLPSPSSDWWDEEEYDVANPVVQTPLKHRPEYIWEPQKSAPNSTTFATMIRYLAWAGQRTLCEHYMVLAVEQDTKEAESLREQLSVIMNQSQSNAGLKPDVSLASIPETSETNNNDKQNRMPLTQPMFIPSPRVFITPLMLYPVIGYANRYRLTEFIYWIRRQVQGLQIRKEADLAFLKEALFFIPSASPIFSAGTATRLNNRNLLCKYM